MLAKRNQGLLFKRNNNNNMYAYACAERKNLASINNGILGRYVDEKQSPSFKFNLQEDFNCVMLMMNNLTYPTYLLTYIILS